MQEAQLVNADSDITSKTKKEYQSNMKRIATAILGYLIVILFWTSPVKAQNLMLGDFEKPTSYFNASVGATAPFSFDYKNGISQQIYTASELQGLDEREITKLEFRIYIDAEVYKDEYSNDITIYLSNVDNDTFVKEGTQYKWIPIDEANDCVARKTVKLNLMDITTSSYLENGSVKYYPLSFELDRPFLYKGKSLLLSIRTKSKVTADDGPGRSYLDFCSYPKNVKGMPVRMVCSYTDKAVKDGFNGIFGSKATYALKDRAVMRITHRKAALKTPTMDPQNPIITTTKAGELSTLMVGIAPLECHSITVKGPMNDVDCSFIRDNMGNLVTINIAEATFSDGKLPSGAFQNLPLVEKVVLPNSITTVGESALAQMYKLTEVVMANNVTHIGEHAFTDCKLLSKIKVSSKLSEIDAYAFKGCNALASFDFVSSLTSIGTECFSGCSALTTVILPKGITKVVRNAFSSCKALKKVHLSANLTQLEFGAFGLCSSLGEVTVEAKTPPTIHPKSFNGVKLSNVVLYVPAESVEQYKTTNWWKQFKVFAIKETETPKETYAVTFKVEGEHGKLIAKLANGTELTTGGEVEKGTVISFTVDPDVDYLVNTFMVNGESVALNENRYTIAVEKPLDVVVSFIHRPYRVTYSVVNNQGGTITATYKGKDLPSGGVTPVGEAEPITFTAHPDKNYHVARWIVNGKESPKPAENNQWQVIAGKDYLVEVVFERDEVYYNVKVQQHGNGGSVFLDVEGVRTLLNTRVKENASIRVSVEPNDGFTLDYWMLNGEKVASNVGENAYETRVNKDLNIEAYFKKADNAVESIERNELSFYCTSGKLHFIAPIQGELTIFTLEGNIRFSQYVSEGVTSVSLAKGVYLVSFQGKCSKITIQ